jgi:iron complex outermembrane recepter protein
MRPYCKDNSNTKRVAKRLGPARLPMMLALAFSTPATFAADTVLPEVPVTANQAAAALDIVSDVGSRLGLSVLDTPASVESVSADTATARGDYDVRDAVTRTTGLTDFSTPGDGGISYSARGFAGNNSVGVTEEGSRVMVGAGTVTGPVTMWGYERMEVLRGIGSIVNGTATVGATVNAVRKAPDAQSSAEALLGMGDYGIYRAGVGGTGGIGSVGAFRIDAYAEGSNGFVDRGDSGSSKIMSSFRFDLASNVRLDFQADHSVQTPTRYWGTPVINGVIDKSIRDRNYNVEDAKIQYVDNRVFGRLSWEISPGLTVRDEVTYLEAKRHWRDAEYYVYDPATRLVDRSSDGYTEILHNQKQTGNRLEVAYDTKDNRFVAGWEAMTIDFLHTNNFTGSGNTFSSSVPLNIPVPGVFTSTDPTVPAYDTRTRAQAFYVDNAYNLTDMLILTTGLRNDGYRYSRTNLTSNSGFDTNLNSNSVRLGLSYKVQPDTALYAQASTGSDPIGSLLSLNLAQSKFKLTDAKQAEVGVKQGFAEGRGMWTAALYQIKKDNIITRDPNNLSQSVQGGSQSSRGIELSSSLSLTRNWRVDANLALLNARFDALTQSVGGSAVSLAGKRPMNVPEQVANLWLAYSTGAWEAGTGARYVGKRFADDANTQTLDAYTVFDATAAWRLSSTTKLRLNLRNLTDRVYATAAYSPTQVYLGAPRYAEVVAEFKF